MTNGTILFADRRLSATSSVQQVPARREINYRAYGPALSCDRDVPPPRYTGVNLSPRASPPLARLTSNPRVGAQTGSGKTGNRI